MGSLKIFFLAAGLAFPTFANGHGGGLDKNGCHTNRKTGEYHCHRGAPSPAAPHAAPVKRGAMQFVPSQLAPSTAPSTRQPSGRTQRDVHFGSCAEARAAGYWNIKYGEPGYSSNLDRDGDGIACER